MGCQNLLMGGGHIDLSATISLQFFGLISLVWILFHVGTPLLHSQAVLFLTLNFCNDFFWTGYIRYNCAVPQLGSRYHHPKAVP